jgi:hypothetical protein
MNIYKNITAEPLFKNYENNIFIGKFERILTMVYVEHFYSSIEDSEVVLDFEINNVGLKKLSSFV